MEITEKIPNYVFEDDLLFQRRLYRTLNAEYEKLSALLVKQVRLLREREALMSTVHAAVQQRCADEEPSEVIVRTEHTEREEYPERPSLADHKDEED
jgi:hypothetical protein